MRRIVYFVSDLLFVSKIREVARQLGLEAERAQDPESLQAGAAGAAVVILDLRQARALEALDGLAADPKTARVPSVGFVDHERIDVMEAARAKGCREVLAKGKFSAELPRLLAVGDKLCILSSD